ncbi:MAG: TMEM43 family protein [Kiritimatiellae bacterium]|nr:TMEM43 family protein [Kiritimatiellia bacterium]
MAVTETTTESWGSRLGGSLRGVIMGGAMFLAGFPVLFWNEGNSVKTAKAIDEGEGACISLESNAKVDPEMNGKLVHLTGKADTQDVLSDDTFGVSATAIRLERQVEMYQWIEESRSQKRKKLGGSEETVTTYTYKKDWASHAIDSSGFKEQGHDNPGAMEFESDKMLASNVSFGAFRLNSDQIGLIGSAQDYKFGTNFTCKVERVKIQGSTIYVPNAETRNNPKNVRDVFSQTRIGDMRVKFRVVYPHEISLIAKQQGDTFVSYTAKNGKKLSYLAEGVQDAAAMFETARTNNAIMTWLVRIGGFLLMFIGMSMVFKPLSVLADVLPILGDIVEMGMGLVAGLIAIICSLVTIAIAWLFYRPVLGIILLAVAGFFGWKLIQKRKAAKAAKAAAGAPVA